MALVSSTLKYQNPLHRVSKAQIATFKPRKLRIETFGAQRVFQACSISDSKKTILTLVIVRMHRFSQHKLCYITEFLQTLA